MTYEPEFPRFKDREKNNPQYKKYKKIVPIVGQANTYAISDFGELAEEEGTPLDAQHINAFIINNAYLLEYYCNGVDDNYQLSEISKDFFKKSGDFANLERSSLYIYVIGKVGSTGIYKVESGGPHYEKTGYNDNNVRLFNFGVDDPINNSNGQKLYINWESAIFRDVDGACGSGGSKNVSYTVIHNAGPRYIEHRGAQINVNVGASYTPLDPGSDLEEGLNVSVFSGSHGRYADCVCNLRFEKEDSISVGYEVLMRNAICGYTGILNSYEKCGASVFGKMNTTITALGGSALLECNAFQGAHNSYYLCEGFARAEHNAEYNAVIIEDENEVACVFSGNYADFAGAQAAGAFDSVKAHVKAHLAGSSAIEDSKFNHCTFKGTHICNYSGNLSSGSNETKGGYGIYSDNDDIDDNCRIKNSKFPHMILDKNVVNSDAYPIYIVGNGNATIKDNKFSDQLELQDGENWPNSPNVEASGNEAVGNLT